METMHTHKVNSQCMARIWEYSCYIKCAAWAHSGVAGSRKCVGTCAGTRARCVVLWDAGEMRENL